CAGDYEIPIPGRAYDGRQRPTARPMTAAGGRSGMAPAVRLPGAGKCAVGSRHPRKARYRARDVAPASHRDRLPRPPARSPRGGVARGSPGPRGKGRMTAYWPLLGVAVVVAGFGLKQNPVLVVVLAGLVSGVLAGKSPGELLELLGTSFVDNRKLLLFTLTLPVIGVL